MPKLIAILESSMKIQQDKIKATTYESGEVEIAIQLINVFLEKLGISLKPFFMKLY